MENYNAQQLTQKRRGVFSISFTGIAFTVLCIYLALIALQYIEGFSSQWLSLALYGFAALSALFFLAQCSFQMMFHSKWCFAVVMMCGFSCLYAYNRSVAWRETQDMAKILIFSVAFTNVVKTKKQSETCMLVTTVAPLILFVYLLATDQLNVKGRLGNELTGNANIFATIFMAGAICSVYFVFHARNKLWSILSTVTLCIQLYAIALAGSRKFFLIPIGLFAALKLMSADKNGRRHIVRDGILVGALVLAVGWMLFNVDVLYNSIGYRMEGMINGLTGSGEADKSTKYRMYLIDKGIALWLQKPVFGWGINNFKPVSGEPFYAHNNYAELLCDVGLIGIAIYYSFSVAMLVKLIKRKNKQTQDWFWLFTLAALLIFDYGAVSYNMYHIQILLMLASVSQQDWANQRRSLTTEGDSVNEQRKYIS